MNSRAGQDVYGVWVRAWRPSTFDKSSSSFLTLASQAIESLGLLTILSPWSCITSIVQMRVVAPTMELVDLVK